MDPLETSSQKTFLERFGASIFIGFVVLLPLFLIPSLTLPFLASKAVYLYIGVFLLIALAIFERLKQGSVRIPWSPILLGSVVLVFAYALSAALSKLPMTGFIGRGYEIDTVLSIFVLSLLMFLVPQYFRSKQSVFNFFIGLFAVFAVVFLYGLIRVVAGPSVFTFGGVLSSTVSNLVGSWNDLGVFAGLVTVVSLIMLEVVPPRGILRSLLYAALVASLLSLAVINFTTIWYVIAFFTFAVMIYVYVFAQTFMQEGDSNMRRSIPKISLVIFLVSLLFAVTGNDLLGASRPSLNIGNRISEGLGISQLEARPSWGTTFEIASKSLQENMLTGAGPNQFVYEWMKHRPKVVNESAFWNVEFNYGIGIIPSAAVSVGLIGLLAWLIFLGFFSVKGMQSLRRPRGDLFSYYLSVTSFAGALFLWVMAILYTVSLVPFALAFIFTGLFLASLSLGGNLRERVISFTDEPGTRFLVLIGSGVIAIGVLAGIFFVGERTLALAYFNRALITFNSSGDLAKAEIDVRRAIAIDGQDSYYRGLSQIALANLNQAASQVTANTPPDQIRNQFQLLLGGAIASAQAARDANPEYYQNWLSLGQAYESVVPLKIEGAYDNAKAAYQEALKKNPTSPAISLTLARLDVLNNDSKGAKENLTAALTKKSNFTDAIFLLSQIQVAEGDLKSAITSTESVATLNPNDATVFFQLGFLYYNDRTYDKAIAALERAVALQPTYANARYFLGLSYDMTRQKPKAIEQFQAIQQTNADNEEVKFILANLTAGRAAFEGVQPPLDNKPEKRKTPPVSEKSAKSTPEAAEEAGL
jgi:tetratricopeptide (TPR) repeat protein